MGSSNSTSLYASVTNNTSIQTTINQQLSVNSSTSSQILSSSTVNISSADPAVCCAGFAGSDLQTCTNNLLQASLAGANTISCPGGLLVSQVGRVTSTQSATVTQAVTNQLVSALTQTTQNQVNDIINQQNDASFINSIFGSSNNSKTTSIISNSISNSLTANLTSTTISNVRQQSGQTDLTSIATCYAGLSGSQCKITQNFSISLYQSQVAGLTASVIASNEDAIKLYNAISAQSTQKNRNWLDNISDIERIFLIAVVAIILIGGVLGLIVLLKIIASHKHESHSGARSNYTGSSHHHKSAKHGSYGVRSEVYH